MSFSKPPQPAGLVGTSSPAANARTGHLHLYHVTLSEAEGAQVQM